MRSDMLIVFFQISSNLSDNEDLTIFDVSYSFDRQVLMNIVLNAILADHAEKEWHCSRRRDLQQREELRSKRSQCLTIRTYLSIDLSDLRVNQWWWWVIEIKKIDFIDFACKEKEKKLRSGFRAGRGILQPEVLQYAKLFGHCTCIILSTSVHAPFHYGVTISPTVILPFIRTFWQNASPVRCCDFWRVA